MFDIARLKQLAGVPINESYDNDDDDDGLSPAERKLAAKADSDLKKKGISVGKVDPDKDMHTLANRRKAADSKKEKDEDKAEKESAARSAAEKHAAEKEAPKADDSEDDKPEPKKEAPKAEEKKEEPKKEETKAEEAKRRGKAPNPESFNQHAKSNAKGMTRGQFLNWAAEKHGKGKAYASALFAKYNPKSGRAVATDAKECYMIAHPNMPSYMLHENRMMNQMQWVDLESDNEPMIFESKDEAEKVIKYMSEWKSQDAKLVTIDLSESIEGNRLQKLVGYYTDGFGGFGPNDRNVAAAVSGISSGDLRPGNPNYDKAVQIITSHGSSVSDDDLAQY